MVFAPAAMDGIYAEVFTGLPRMVSGVPAEMKNYLRVDYDDDDSLIESIIRASEKICMDVARMDDAGEFAAVANVKIAVPCQGWYPAFLPPKKAAINTARYCPSACGWP